MIGMMAVARGLTVGTRQTGGTGQHVCSGQEPRRLLRHNAVSGSRTVLRTGTVDFQKLPYPAVVPSQLCDLPIPLHVGAVGLPHNTWPLHRDDRQPYYMRSHIKTLLRRQKDIAGETVIIAVPGEVSTIPVFSDILASVRIIHGAGARVVLVVGTSAHIVSHLQGRGSTAQNVGKPTVTNITAMAQAIGAVAVLHAEIEGAMCKVDAALGLPWPYDEMVSLGPEQASTASVVSGNYVTARRVGIVDGVDFGAAGTVRYVREAPVRQQLDMRHLVLLTDLGVSMCGEALLCGVHDVALHAAAELKADRLIFLDTGMDATANNVVPFPKHLTPEEIGCMVEKGSASTAGLDTAVHTATVAPHQASTLFASLTAASDACQRGVPQCHVIPAHLPGALLHELYGPGGIGTQISARPQGPAQTLSSPPCMPRLSLAA